MQLEIISPERVVRTVEAKRITAPTVQGEITILPHHINLLTRIEAGELVLETDEGEESLAIAGGYLEVNDEKVAILADYAAPAEEIELEQAEAAAARAQALLQKQSALSDEELVRIQGELRLALLQQKIASKRRSNR